MSFSPTSEQSDWPQTLWRFPLSNDVIPSNKGTLPVAIIFGKSREDHSLGGHGGCWVGGRGPVFGSAHTAATTSVLAAELESCRELLTLEPDNKCRPLTHTT